jgi:hypothetical protein
LKYATVGQSLNRLICPLLTTSQWLVGVYLLRSVKLLFRWRDAVNDAAYMNVVVGGDGADELFETTEAVGHFRLFRLFVLVYHSSLDVASDLVEISSFISILMSFNENAVVISWHAHIVNEIDIKRHDDSNKFAVMMKEV